jgi:acyl-CoA hydrolase
MDIASLYQSKLTTPDHAMTAVPSGSKLSMGMAMAEPPALLKALADRAEAGGIEDLKLYYFESTRNRRRHHPSLRADRPRSPVLYVHRRDRAGADQAC